MYATSLFAIISVVPMRARPTIQCLAFALEQIPTTVTLLIRNKICWGAVMISMNFVKIWTDSLAIFIPDTDVIFTFATDYSFTNVSRFNSSRNADVVVAVHTHCFFIIKTSNIAIAKSVAIFTSLWCLAVNQITVWIQITAGTTTSQWESFCFTLA